MIEKEEIELMEQRIQNFNDFVMAQDIEKMPIGLFSGKMGLCIYFYHQEQISLDRIYKNKADKLLKSIFKDLNDKTLINNEEGLIGVCLGINYLIENGFQSGNINHILSELDDKIYQTTWLFLMEKSAGSAETLNSAFEIALYFTIRLQNKKLSKNNRFLFESIVIKAINCIENYTSYADKYIEPLSYSLNNFFISNYIFLLAKVHQLGFYNYKIEKIIDEIYPKIYSIYPFQQSNRLQFASALEYLNNELHRSSIDECLIRLHREINYEQFIQSEFRNQNILLINGLSGFYLIHAVLFNNRYIPKELIASKIILSKLWDVVFDDNFEQIINIGLFSGLAGVILIYQHILKQLTYEV